VTAGDTPVRVALIGLGWAVRELWAPRLAAHPAYTVVAAHDPDPATRAWAAVHLPAARLLDHPGDLDPGGVDLAVVATPNHLHASTAAALLRRGIATFVEKPVCVTSAEAATLAAAERTGGAPLLAGSAAWHRADVAALRALLPELGPLRAVELSWIRANGIPAPGSWFTHRRRAGGGALVDLGWHVLTVGLRLLGWPRVAHVTGTVSSDFLTRTGTGATWRGDTPTPTAGTRAGGGSASGGGGAGAAVGGSAAPCRDVEDTARGVLAVDGGPLVSVAAAWASHQARDVTRLVLEGAAGRAELRCTFGLSPHGVPSQLVVWRDGRAEAVPVAPEERGAEYRRQLDRLPALLADPARAGVAAAEAARTVEVVERLYAAAGRVSGVGGAEFEGGVRVVAPEGG
jgi:oxidoreductase